MPRSTSQTLHESRGPGRPAGVPKGEARASLLRAARTLLTEKGLPSVTSREVAERAGLNPALVHYYFGSKDGLLRAVVSEIAGEAQARTVDASVASGDARERMRTLVAAMVESFAAEPYAARLFSEQIFFAEDEVVDEFVEAFGRSHIELLRGVLTDGVRSGAFRDVDPELTIPAITGMVMFFFLGSPVFLRAFGRDALSPEYTERFAGAVTSLLFDGIASTSAEAGEE